MGEKVRHTLPQNPLSEFIFCFMCFMGLQDIPQFLALSGAVHGALWYFVECLTHLRNVGGMLVQCCRNVGGMFAECFCGMFLRNVWCRF